MHYFNTKAQMDGPLSTSPSMLDTMQNPGDWTFLGNALNPQETYGNNSAQMPRGGFVYDVVTNTPTTATVQSTLTVLNRSIQSA